MESVTESSVNHWEKWKVNYGMEKFVFTIHKSLDCLKKRVPYQSLFYKQIETWNPLVEKAAV